MNLEKIIKMCLLSKLAYQNENDVKHKLTQLHYTHFKWFDHKGTQAFAVWDCYYKTVIICFRGTELVDVNDFKYNINIWPHREKYNRSKGFIHFGFTRALNMIYKNIVNYLVDLKFNLPHVRIICTGHSLGAAIATIAAHRLDANELYTFGSPKVGTRLFVKHLEKDNVFHIRVVNENDIITTLPTIFYKHHTQGFRLCKTEKCNKSVTSHMLNNYIYNLLKIHIASNQLKDMIAIIYNN
jgi:hypothetical protein